MLFPCRREAFTRRSIRSLKSGGQDAKIITSSSAQDDAETGRRRRDLHHNDKCVGGN